MAEGDGTEIELLESEVVCHRSQATDTMTLAREALRARAKASWNKLGGPSIRSCWNCNAAHEHLKESPFVVLCFTCRKFYFEGQDVTD